MAWTSPATHVFVTGEVVSPSTMNTFIKDNLLALWQRTLADTSIIPGTAPPAGVGIFPQVGSAVVDLASPGTGGFTINLPRAFGTGLVAVNMGPGSTIATPGPNAAWFATPISNNHTLSSIGGIARDYGGAALLSGLVRIDFAAWGWD
jgi:hypothetical protein